MKTILVLWASSYLWARIYRDIKEIFEEVTWTYFWNKIFPELDFLDLTDQSSVELYLTRKKPSIIIHCASNANAKWCSENPEKATLLNITSTKYIVDICKSIKCSLVYISSIAYYFESLYAESKRLSENYITQSNLQFLILRPSLILGASPNTDNDRPHNRFLKTIFN